MSHQAEKEVPGQSLQYVVITLSHNTVHKVLPQNCKIQNNNCWRILLVVKSLFSGFTAHPLRSIDRTQGSLLSFVREYCLSNRLLRATITREFFFDNWDAACRNLFSLWLWGYLVVNKNIWEVLFSRPQEDSFQGWDLDIVSGVFLF